jgi:chemotaxis protein CheD
LSAVLGSCVAVCLWDNRHRLGGMTHFVLPRTPEGQASPRYGDVAIHCLRDGLGRLGAEMEELRAKVFGGADVLACGSQRSVGTANVGLALECLRGYSIPVTVRRTGGKRGRLIRFHTRTGEVLVRSIPASRVIHGAGADCATR